MPIDIQKLFFLCRPLGPIYGFGMQFRQTLYHRTVLRSSRLSAPVISVGNLVLGGTGKTPVVQYLAQFLQKRGYRPAIISRGYRGTAKQAVNIVSAGKGLLLSPAEAGDEPAMLAQSLPDIPILTGKRRALPAQYAIDQFNARCIILDDGFQHLGLQRDLDIVLFDATTLAGNSRIFPGGPLREPVSALKRCHCFLMTGENSNNIDQAELFADLLTQKFPDRPVFHATTEGLQLRGETEEASITDHCPPLFAFCGIANPERFQLALKDQGFPVCGFQSLPDHVRYTEQIIGELYKKAKAAGGQGFITTEKDAVKLEDKNLPMPLFVAKLRTKISPEFDDFIISNLEKRAS